MASSGSGMSRFSGALRMFFSGSALILMNAANATKVLRQRVLDVMLSPDLGAREDKVQIPTARIDILLTHLHMDHIQGLGSFGPLCDPGVDVHIWGPASSMLQLEARLSRYLSPPLFSVHLRDLPKVVCHEAPRPPFDIGPFRIRTALVCHPGPTVGYRIEAAGASTAYLSDHEPALGLPNGRWPAPDWISGYDLAFNADTRTRNMQAALDGAQHLPARFRVCGSSRCAATRSFPSRSVS